jgi:hypothetical protein
MKFAISAAMVAALGLLTLAPARAASIADLQHLLNNAGYNAGPATGQWSDLTASAAAEFVTRYGVAAGDLKAAPDESALSSLITDAGARLDAEYAAFPTQKLPDHYFVALGDSNYFSITEWSNRALVVHDGKQGSVPITRFYQPIDEDIPLYKSAGVSVIRMQLGMDGALFFNECDYRSERGTDGLDACFAKAYADAGATKWTRQTELLSHPADNPVLQLYLDDAQKWIERGFHVIVVPLDFYNGNGSHFDGSDDPSADSTPLFHRALMHDTAFQQFYPKFVATVVGMFKQRHLTNFSLQSANEPRFCGKDNKPEKGGLAKWQALERTEFDAVRKVAPRLSLISTAICTAGVSYFDAGRPYTELGNVMPFHEDLDDVTYALHLYSPSALFGAGAAHARFKAGTVIHYPYKKLATSTALNDDARFSVSNYNGVKVGPKFFAKLFGDIGTFAKKRGVRVMLTETGIPKPNFGIPREDRIHALRDIIEASRAADVSVTYFDEAGSWGLSSCDMDNRVPDHRFDPALLNLLAFGNGVAGVDLDAPLVPIESLCGNSIYFDTVVQDAGPNSVMIDTIFTSTVGMGTGVTYNLRGSFLATTANFLGSFEITLLDPTFGKTTPDGLVPCGGRVVQSDHGPRLLLRYKVKDKLITTPKAECLLALVPEEMKAAVHMLTDQFADVAADFAAGGDFEKVENPYLREWYTGLANGTLAVAVAP